MKRLIIILVAVLATQILPGVVLAKEARPDANIKLSQGQVAAGIGWSWGNGVLTFHGKSYPFKVDGLSVGDVGITKAVADGKVYHLKNLADFSGTYVSAAAEATLALGAGATVMKNENGVTIYLYPVTKGLNLKLGGEGVKFALQK
jgi:hypothetical protein